MDRRDLHVNAPAARAAGASVLSVGPCYFAGVASAPSGLAGRDLP